MLPVVVVEVFEEFLTGDKITRGRWHEVFEDAVFGGGEIDGNGRREERPAQVCELDAGVAEDGMRGTLTAADESLGREP